MKAPLTKTHALGSEEIPSLWTAAVSALKRAEQFLQAGSQAWEPWEVQILMDLAQTYWFNKLTKALWCTLELENYWFKRTAFLKGKRSEQ